MLFTVHLLLALNYSFKVHEKVPGCNLTPFNHLQTETLPCAPSWVLLSVRGFHVHNIIYGAPTLSTCTYPRAPKHLESLPHSRAITTDASRCCNGRFVRNDDQLETEIFVWG